jgi:hypothetical protein
VGHTRFFVTAAHLPELVKNRSYKLSLQQKELIVQICDELANRGKHGKTERKKPAVIHTNYDGYVARGYVAPGYCKVTLQVTLTREAAQKLRIESQVTDVVALATIALEFWKAHEAFKGGR